MPSEVADVGSSRSRFSANEASRTLACASLAGAAEAGALLARRGKAALAPSAATVWRRVNSSWGKSALRWTIGCAAMRFTARIARQLPVAAAALTNRPTEVERSDAATERRNIRGGRAGARGLSEQRLCADQEYVSTLGPNHVPGPLAGGPEPHGFTWVRPGQQLADQTGHRDLQPRISSDDDLPVGFDAARRADRRMRADAVICVFPDLSAG